MMKRRRDSNGRSVSTIGFSRRSETASALADEIYAKLKQEIIKCTIPPGQKVYATELADRYKVSKTPVRDALRLLAEEGLVESYPRSGYQVREVTFQDAYELLDLRAFLGPPAARLAAATITAEQLAELEAIVTAAYDRKAGHEEILAASRRFHVLVARASGNTRLANITESIFAEMERLFRFCLDLSIPAQQMGSSHYAMIEALRQHDGDRAAAVETEHVQAVKQFIMRSLLEAARLGNLPLPSAAEIGPNRLNQSKEN